MKLVKFGYTKTRELQQKESVYRALNFPESGVSKFKISKQVFRLLFG